MWGGRRCRSRGSSGVRARHGRDARVTGWPRYKHEGNPLDSPSNAMSHWRCSLRRERAQVRGDAVGGEALGRDGVLRRERADGGAAQGGEVTANAERSAQVAGDGPDVRSPATIDAKPRERPLVL